jgi:hypothetical protein
MMALILPRCHDTQKPDDRSVGGLEMLKLIHPEGITFCDRTSAPAHGTDAHKKAEKPQSGDSGTLGREEKVAQEASNRSAGFTMTILSENRIGAQLSLISAHR